MEGVENLMEQQEKVLNSLDDFYGITVQPIENESFKNYKKINDKKDFSRFNACLKDILNLLKNAHDKKYYSGAYKVIYDKGLGTLQKTAENPNLFRANIVEPGTNNHITGQAVLQELNPTELMKVTNIAMTAYTVAAMATSQYYLASIDNKLTDIDKKVDEIKSFLEIDKESQLWADGEFLRGIKESLEFILEDNVYRQANLTSIQSIRRNSLANIKLYQKQLISDNCF